MRAALYARFSSELQNAGSIGDQLAACRRHAERLGATVVAEFSDAAISGASMVGRPGLADLMAGARRGGFDVVIAEALDRLTRSGGDAWDIFEDLKGAGVRISTISEGAVDELHVGLKGTMNALFLRDLGLKVRRGLEGVVRDGRHAAHAPFGYRRKLVYDAKGEPIRGLIEIHEPEAAVVRRVAAEFVAGLTAYRIVSRLNQEGVPGPGGRTWVTTAITGRAAYLDGLLRNPIYAGERVWNRTSQTKDRRTGKIRTRQRPESEWVRQAAPELRILDPASWATIQARLVATAEAVRAAGNPSAANAPKRLLAGLVRCGLCGGMMHVSGGGPAYRCLARMQKGVGVCANARTARPDQLEAGVLEHLRDELLHPELVETFIREYQATQRQLGAGRREREAAVQRELGEVRRRADRLVDQVADGLLSGPTVSAKLAELEARAAALEAELAEIRADTDVVAYLPVAASRYRRLLEELQAALARADAGSVELEEARGALRQVVRAVYVYPLPERGKWRFEVDGDLTTLLATAPSAAARQRA